MGATQEMGATRANLRCLYQPRVSTNFRKGNGVSTRTLVRTLRHGAACVSAVGHTALVRPSDSFRRAGAFVRHGSSLSVPAPRDATSHAVKNPSRVPVHASSPRGGGVRCGSKRHATMFANAQTIERDGAMLRPNRDGNGRPSNSLPRDRRVRARAGTDNGVGRQRTLLRQLSIKRAANDDIYPLDRAAGAAGRRSGRRRPIRGSPQETGGCRQPT